MKRIVTGLLFLVCLAISAPCVAEYVITANLPEVYVGFSNLNPIADFDGDGSLEVVTMTRVTASEVHATICDAATGQLEGDVTMPSTGSPMTATAAKVDDDLLPEIVAFRLDQFADVYIGYVVIDFVGTTAGPPAVAPTLELGSTVNPNPFNPSTTISYSVPHQGTAVLSAFDASGRLVRTLVNGTVEPGKHSITWDGRDDAGRQLSSGTYFYELRLDGQIFDSGKAVILK